MEQMISLTLDEMAKVTGGSSKTIQTREATVFSGPGKDYAQVGALSAGVLANYTGSVSFNDQDGINYYLISSPMYGWIRKVDLGL